ncbi:MAG TPA: outer membrane protein assembly factor BamD, partial [Candidatus Cryptobacteroides sp.]|nr:outer membrane protein assembly factor BamD [Candidatus Cryptobacteroides sp.]
SPDSRLEQSKTYTAIIEFQKYIERYPQTERAEQAKDYLFELQEKLALKELQAAELYLNLGNYMGNNYEAAVMEFSQVNLALLPEAEQSECIFKKAYSFFSLGKYNAAIKDFVQLQSRPYSSYTAPSCFYLAYMAYSIQDFEIAELWFKKAVVDERFKSLAEYYIMECRFMSDDYDFVLKNAPAMLDTLPAERQGRMARIISESYLVRGQSDKALQYLNKESKPDNRTDFFHAGSVLYAVEDYKGAIENFSRMEARIDSIGQVASYQLGYSYIQTGNKVSAAAAFKEASQLSFDSVIQEDAAFNYAKLSFDLNGDTTPFSEYIDKYSTEKRGEQIYNYMA